MCAGQTSRKAFALTGMLLLMFVVGCENNHKKNVDAANTRWLNVRSNLMLEMATQQFETGDLNLAEKTVRDAMSIDPGNARLHVLAGRIAIERGQLERAYHVLTTAIELNPRLPTAHYYQGLVVQRWQQYEAAYNAYQQAYDLEADNAGYLMAMSEMLVELNRESEALSLLESKLTYFDQNAGLRLSIAHLYAIQRNHAKAAEFFEKAALLRPDDLKIREELALSQVQAGQLDKATANLERLVQESANRDRVDLRRALAGAYLKSGRLSDARSVLTGLTRHDPSVADDWLKLGELAWAQGDSGMTLTCANRLISLAPHRHEGYLLAGMVWQKRGRLDDALKLFDRAAELAPVNAVPVILRGIALERAGRMEAAAEAYAEALRRQPDDHRAARLLESVMVELPRTP